MDSILVILLSLGAINSPNVYYSSQIDNFAHIYSVPIQNTEDNPALMNALWLQFLPEADAITVLDDGELR